MKLFMLKMVYFYYLFERSFANEINTKKLE
jgi:hypothetical protein